MGAGRLAALYLLALAVPLADALLGHELALGPCAALALLPWLAFAPLPRRAGGAPTGALALAALALPPLALGAGLDLARGTPAGALALAAGTSWLVLIGWSLAAERAARPGPLREVYPLLWFALVPLGLALRVALAWVPARGSESPQRAAWLALDPLLFCHGWGRPGGLAELALSECAFALLGAGLALACTGLAVRARGIP